MSTGQGRWMTCTEHMEVSVLIRAFGYLLVLAQEVWTTLSRKVDIQIKPIVGPIIGLCVAG